MSATRTLDLVVDDGIWFEGPRWRDGALYWSDIGANTVQRMFADGRREVVARDIPGASGLGWAAAGDMLVASIGDSTVYKVGADGAVSALCGPDAHGTLATNDMASAGGRSYVSCAGRVMGPDDTIDDVSQPCGAVVMVDHATGAGRIVASGYRMPNGIAFGPGGATLVFSELFASRLYEFDVAADGSLENRRVFAELHAPCDGLCMDAVGAVWCATHHDFTRIDRDRGVIDRIPIDGWTCIACALGGADGRDLFLLVSRSERPQDIFKGRSRSRILRTRVDVPAAPVLG
jgi:sugar lactone lactonase YvrE